MMRNLTILFSSSDLSEFCIWTFCVCPGAEIKVILMQNHHYTGHQNTKIRLLKITALGWNPWNPLWLALEVCLNLFLNLIHCMYPFVVFVAS